MADNDFRFDAVAGLKETESQKQVKKDIKSFLSNIKIPLIGTLSSKTKAQLMKNIASLNGVVNLTGKVDSKGVASSLQQATTQAQKQVDSKPIDLSFSVKKEKLLNDIKLLAQQNSKLFKDNDMTIKYNTLLDNAEIARNSVELSTLRTQLGSLRSELKISGNSGLTFGDSLKKSLSKIIGLFGNFNIIMQFKQQLKNAWTEAKTLDDSLVDLQKVTDTIADRDALYKYFDRAMNKAQDLNVKVNSLIYAITEFKKLGWSLSDAELGGEWATILENVGDVSIDTAIGSIKTAIASFDEIGGYTDMQMDKKLEAYTDLINNMSNKYSIDAEGLAEAIRLSAGTLTEAHTSIEQAATMFSTANKYYNDASYLGHTVKIGSLRMRASEGDSDAIAELEDMGEEIDSLTEATSSLREKLMALTGVDIMVDEHTFKSYYDQLYEISQVIDELDDTSRANVLETLFGKNRSAAGAALLSGMKESADAYKDAINSAGSATKEYETWMQSADAASQRFANNLTKTYQSIINGNTVRDFTNLGSAVLEFANSCGLVEGTLKGGLMIGVMKGIANFTVALKNSAVQVSNYGVALEAVNKLGNFAEGTDEYVDKIDKLKTSCSVLTDTQLKQVLAHKNLSDVQLIEILQLKDLEEEQRKARLTQLGLTQATEEQTAASMANLSITNMLRVAWTKFVTFAKANPMTVGITAIVAATYAAIKASEAWSNRLKKQAQESSNAYKDTLEEIESINSELQSNGQRIDELNAKENLTLIESEELEKLKESNRELENTLALKEKIAQQEKASANKDAVKYFNEDTNKYNKETGTYDSTHIEVATQYLDEIYKKEQRIHELELEMSRTDSNTEKYRELSGELDIRQKSYDNLFQRVQDYYDTFTELDDNLFEGQDDELIQQLEAFYKYMNEVLYGIAETNTNAIRDILAKVDFQSASKQLEELGKSGELSVSTLSSRFPELIEYLDKAGISANELYQYIMALSNPDAINYDNVRKQLMQSLGFGDTIDNASEAQLWNEISSLSKEELVLEAYLNVKDQYGEHPEGWNAQDWISHIQSELESEIIEINTQLSISDTIDQLNTRLKPALDSLQSAYQDIYNDDGKFDLKSIDILSTCDTIKSKLDELNEIEGITVDYSAYEDFVRVLNNTESTEQDVENAFDSLATSITQAALSGAEDFETMKAALEDLGVVNNEMVAFQALASNTEMLEQALSEANASMDDFIVNTEDGSVEATNAGRAFLEEKVGAENCAEALNILAFHKQLCNLQEMNTSNEVANLRTLAENAGYTGEVIQYLTELEQIYQEVASGTLTKEQILVKTGRAAVLKALIDNAASNINYEPKVDWNNVTKNASKAGSSAGDAYISAFEEELKSLQDLRDRGVIDESEYLQHLRELYTRYFKDRKEYLSEFKKYERQYLEGMKSLYDSALSGITKLMSHQIDGYNEAKDAAVSSLEAEKEARLEVIETQKEQLEAEQDLIDKQIEAKQDIIDSIQKEIDAMKAAREERQRQLDLQKALYDLESLKHQRTIRQYSEEKGIHYVTDDSAIRDAQEKVDDAKFEIEVSKKEKEIKLIEEEIDLLEKQKEAIQDQIDALDKQSENIEKYYSKLISEQEKYWDSMISNMEKQKSKWEELAEIEEIAKAYSAIEQVFGDMGYTVQDILNGNGQAFEDFKSRYIAIMSDMNQNTSFQEGLEYASGVAKENFGSIVSDAQGAVQELSQTFSDGTFSQAITQGVSDGIVSAKQELDRMDELGRDAGDGLLNGWDEKSNLFIEAAKQTAQEAVEAFAEGQDSHSPSEKYKGLAGDAISGLLLGVEENKQSFIDTIRSLAEEGLLAFEEGFQFDESSIKTSFDSLILLIQSVSEALGFGSEGSVNGLLGALSQLSAFSLGDDGKGILSQFENLKTAVDGVISAISGGETSGGSTSGSSDGGSGSGAGGGTGGLVGAIEQFKSAADEALGSGGGENSEGEGSEGGGTGAIGQFEQLKTAVDDVTAAIGSENGEGTGEGDSDTLIGSIDDLETAATDTLGESGGDGVIGRFEKFKDVIGEANEHVSSIYKGLTDIDNKTVECTIKIHIESDGSIPHYASGTALGAMNLESGEYNAKYEGNAHVSGTANVTGNWGVRKPGKSLVGEIGQEIWVHSADGTFETVGDNGPEWIKTEKGDLIFNHLQTRELLDKGNIVRTGTAYANGNIEYSDGTVIMKDGSVLRPPIPGERSYDLMKAFEPLVKKIQNGQEKLFNNAMYEGQRQFEQWTKEITNNSVINNVTNNNRNVQQPVVNHISVTLPNVTNSTSAESLLRDLESLNTKKYQVDW